MTVSRADLAMLGLIGLLLLVTAFLSLAATSLAYITRTRAQALAAAGERRADVLADLLRRAEDIRTPVAILRLTCMLVEATLVGVVGNRVLGTAGLVSATAANVVLTFVLAVAAPTTWATLHPDRTALWVARPVRRLVTLRPVGAISRSLVRVTNAVVPGPGLEGGPYARAEPNPDEETSQSGLIAHSQRELVESIAEFADTVVREVMSPRTDMVIVNDDFRIGDVIEVSLLNGFSRLPVCRDDVDHVVGLVYSKDLMRAERDGFEHRPVAELVRPAVFVPETKRLPELLREMQRQQLHMAIVVDEYGGTAGLVTLEDIIEQLVGDIADEFDVADTLIEPLPGGNLLVRGRTPFQELNARLDMALPDGDWDTAGGLMYGLLGHLPVAGEAVQTGGWELTAERIQGRRISWIRIARAEPAFGPRAGAVPPPRPEPRPASEPAATNGAAGALGSAPGEGGPGEGGPGEGARDEMGPGESASDDEGQDARGGTRRGEGASGNGTPAGGHLPTEPHRPRDDAGFVGGAELLPFGLLVFVVGALLGAQAWAVVDAKYAVESAAREAARSYVEADAGDGATAAGGAEAAAVEAGLQALDAHGRDRGRGSVTLTGTGGFTRCAEVTFAASYDVPTIGLPWIGGFGPGLAVRADHTELVDPYRDGVPGSAEGC